MLLLYASPACVIPVVPEFKDQPESENRPPQILDPVPAFGATAFGQMPTFQITVTDPNPGDMLHVRWLADYPPFGPNRRPIVNLSVAASVDGKPLSQPMDPVSVSCTFNALVPNISLHKIMVIVADRPFDETLDQQDLTKVSSDGLRAIGNWLYQVDCPP